MSVKFVVFVLNSLGYNYLMSGKSHGILFFLKQLSKTKAKIYWTFYNLPQFIGQQGENNMFITSLLKKQGLKYTKTAYI